MPRNTSVSLGEHFAQFIDRQVEGDVTGLQAKWFAQAFACSKSERPPSRGCGPR